MKGWLSDPSRPPERSLRFEPPYADAKPAICICMLLRPFRALGRVVPASYSLANSPATTKIFKAYPLLVRLASCSIAP